MKVGLCGDLLCLQTVEALSYADASGAVKMCLRFAIVLILAASVFEMNKGAKGKYLTGHCQLTLLEMTDFV